MTEPTPTTTKPAPATAHAQTSRRALTVMIILAAAVGVGFLILPMLYKAHYQYLLWSEGFMERAFAQAFVTGDYQKLIEAPKPLWNMFWLLSELPNRLFFFIAGLVAVVFLLFQMVSRKLTGSILYGILAFFILLFGYKDVLVLFTNGNWTVPYLLLSFLALFALLNKRWGWATAAIGLSGLVRPESWLLAIFLLGYLAYQREQFRWWHFLPLLAPLIWAVYDYRISGDWLYTYKNTIAYAILTGISGTNFLNFWPRLIPDIIESTGVVVLLYALVGVILRMRNISQETKKRKFLAVIMDPLFAIMVLPFLMSWVLSIQGNLVIMRRFFYLSIALLTLYAVLMPYELLARRKTKREKSGVEIDGPAGTQVVYKVKGGAPRHMNAVSIAILLPVLLVALVRLPGISRDTLRDLKVTEAKMAAIVGLCEEVIKPLPNLDQYKQIFIPFRRYAQFSTFITDPAITSRFLSYRELSLAVTATQYTMMGEEIDPPAGSPRFVKDLLNSRKQFSDFLPSIALWIPDDERHYIDAFSFDDPEFFHKNYIDKGRYAFRIIGSALDSLGLIYEVREITPEQVQEVITPEGEAIPAERFQGEE